VRLLHTADWHVGKPLRGRSRMEEYARALEQVARVARDRKVDAVLVAGDIFDSPAPPPEAEKLVYDFLARLVSERIACVLIAGNHDHPKKLGALASLLEGLRIHVRPEVRPPDQGGIVSLASRDGKEEARVAVLPFVPERRVVDACTVMDAEHEWFEEYSKRIEQILAALVKGLPATSVNIVLAHLLVDGARVGTGERELHLGQVYGVNPQQLPSTVQYVALGHLHRPQEVLAPAKTRYPGSLIELDFGEQEQEKSVVVLDARPQRPPDIELVPVTAGRRLRTVEGALDDLQRLADERSDDYLRVRVKAEAPTPGLADRVKELLPNALDVTVDHPRDAGAQPERGKGRGKLAPAQLFAAYYEHRNQAPPPKELQQLFDQLHEEAAR
jgi:DNA repair protein SbcD/Mre11